MRPCRRVSADAVPPFYRHEGTQTYAKRPDGAVELDSADRVGLDLGRPVVDHRLAGVRVPHGAQRGFLLGSGGEGPAALVPHVRPRGGCVGHDDLPLYHSVPPRAHGTRADGLVDVVVGRGADGLVLLGGHGALPDRVRGLDLGAAQARRGTYLADGEEPGLVAVCAARFVVAPPRGAVARLHAAHLLVDDRGHDLHVHPPPHDVRAACRLDGVHGESPRPGGDPVVLPVHHHRGDRKSTRLNSSHTVISYAVFCLKKKNTVNANAGARVACAQPLAGAPYLDV